jgi:hypothetical protein
MQTGFVAATPSRVFRGGVGDLHLDAATIKIITPSFAFLNRRLYVQKQGYAGEVDNAT